MKSRYDLPHIRALLTEGFSLDELRALCYDHFRAVYYQITDATGKPELVTRLLEHAEATLQMDTLLALAKEANPDRYNLHRPYHVQHLRRHRAALPDKSLPIWVWVVGSVLGLSLLAGGSFWGIRAIRGPQVAPTTTPTAMPVPTATFTTTPAPTAISMATLESTPTHTLTPTNTPTRASTPTHTPTSTGTPTPTWTLTPTWTPTPGLVQKRAVDYDEILRGTGDASDHEWVPATTDPAMGCPGEDTFAIQARKRPPDPPFTGSQDALYELNGPAVIYEFHLLPATYYLYIRGSAETTDQDAVFISWQAQGKMFSTLLTTEKGLKFRPPKLNWQPGEDQYLGQEPIEVEVETEGVHAFIFHMRKAGLVLKTILLSPKKCDFDAYPCDVEKACGVSG